ncbi:NUDIX domain-containing protein [Mycoplasmatota bacterium WC44]
MKRKRAGVVITCLSKDKVLLIYRKNSNGEYYVIPGGGLEDNETYCDAAKRELNEELGIQLANLVKLGTIETETSIEKYFISIVNDIFEVKILGEERERMSEDNIYVPIWIDIKIIKSLTLFPDEIKDALHNYLDKY